MYSIRKRFFIFILFSFIEKQVAHAPPEASEFHSREPAKEDERPVDKGNDENDAMTPISEPESCSLEATEEPSSDAVVNAETGEEESTALSEMKDSIEPHDAANDGLLATYSDKKSKIAPEEESNDSDTVGPPDFTVSLGENTKGVSEGENSRPPKQGEESDESDATGPPSVTVSLGEDPEGFNDGENALPSKHPHLGDIGKQEPLHEVPSTPVKDTSFASSASSTPVGKLIIPSAEGSTAESSSIGAEDIDEDSSPRTPRQEDQSPRMAEEFIQFWLVMRIFDNEVTIFFHRRY